MAACALALAALVSAQAPGSDPLRDALLLKSRDKLVEITTRVGMTVPDGASDDALRAMIYESAQHEKPAHVPKRRWDGSEMPASEIEQKQHMFKKPADTPQPAATEPGDVSGQMFAALDRDRDGRLSREEMAPMIERTNAQARAQGEEVPADFFGTLDTDGDGAVSRGEFRAFFDRVEEAEKRETRHAQASVPACARAPRSCSSCVRICVCVAAGPARGGCRRRRPGGPGSDGGAGAGSV